MLPLIWAFSIYFGFWHCRTHIEQLISYLGWGDAVHPRLTFYRHAWPLTVLALAGLIVFYVLMGSFDVNVARWSVIFTAVLTLPHLFIVDSMYASPEIQ